MEEACTMIYIYNHTTNPSTPFKYTRSGPVKDSHRAYILETKRDAQRVCPAADNYNHRHLELSMSPEQNPASLDAISPETQFIPVVFMMADRKVLFRQHQRTISLTDRLRVRTGGQPF